MKKPKKIIGIFLLSTILAGNVFAGTTSTGIFGILESFANSVISLMSGDDDSCPTRQCPICRPDEGGDGNCRPQ